MRLIVAAMLLVVSCGGGHSTAPVQPIVEAGFAAGPPLAAPGEHMAYKVKLRGVEVAAYDITVGDVQDLEGHKVVAIQANARSTGVAEMFMRFDDRLTSWVDVTTGRPVRFTADEYETKGGDTMEHVVGRFIERAGDSVPVTVAVGDGTPVAETQIVGTPDVWDYNAFLIALRSWEAKSGTSRITEVFRSRWMWHITTTVGPKETVVTELGELPALRFDSRSFKLDRSGKRFASGLERPFSIWVSDDGGRVPLKITASTDYGDLIMEIVAYEPGRPVN